MKLALSLIVWTLIALAALFVLGPDTSRELPKPKPPPTKPADHALAPSALLPVAAVAAATGRGVPPSAYC